MGAAKLRVESPLGEQRREPEEQACRDRYGERKTQRSRIDLDIERTMGASLG